MRYSALFAHLLHISPWEISLLAADEFEALVEWIDRYQEQMKEASGG